MPEPDFRHIGSVEVLRSRIYPIDPYNKDQLATEVIVEVGHYPLYFNGYSHLWVMTGKLNGQFLRRGDGLMLAFKGANAFPLDITVQFPSKLFGPDDWRDLMEHESTLEGHPEQRLRIAFVR
jgi:hypothetical protein